MGNVFCRSAPSCTFCFFNDEKRLWGCFKYLALPACVCLRMSQCVCVLSQFEIHAEISSAHLNITNTHQLTLFGAIPICKYAYWQRREEAQNKGAAINFLKKSTVIRTKSMTWEGPWNGATTCFVCFFVLNKNIWVSKSFLNSGLLYIIWFFSVDILRFSHTRRHWASKDVCVKQQKPLASLRCWFPFFFSSKFHLCEHFSLTPQGDRIPQEMDDYKEKRKKKRNLNKKRIKIWKVT